MSISLDIFGMPVLTITEPPAAPTWAPRQEVAYVPAPGPADLFRYLGWPPPDTEQEIAAQSHLDRARLLTLAYVRGRGTQNIFIAEDIAAVILSAAARAMNNPTSDAQVTAGQYTARPGQPDWTLQERLTLDLWRRRAA